ncbi:MAG: HypC/HybG/HupF family hydrogenase formation chaperone [Coriobacteriales bacterium]|jgi:hydrogenase expression/formation protein HypC
MCLAVPAQVKDIDEEQRLGTVDILGVTREVALDLVPRAKVGDWILVHAGYGIEVVDEQYANETLELFKEIPGLIDEDHPGMGQMAEG